MRSWVRWAGVLGLLLLVAGCAGKTSRPEPLREPADHTWSLAMRAGQQAFEADRYARAVHFFTQALTRAHALDDGPGSGDAAFNLGVSQLQVGDYQGAWLALLESEAHTPPRQDGAGVQLLLAHTARLRGDSDRARQHLTALSGGPQTSPQEMRVAPELKEQARLLERLLDCESGERQAGHTVAGDAGLPGSAASELVVRRFGLKSAGLELRACYLRQRGDHVQHAQTWDRIVESLKHSRRYSTLPDALAQSAEAYRAAGDLQRAAERWYRAAQSALGQSRPGSAQQALEAARQSAGAAGDVLLLKRIERSAGRLGQIR